MIAPDAGARQALNWIADRLREKPDADRLLLIDEASQRFGLSPLQAEFLLRQFLTGRPDPSH